MAFDHLQPAIPHHYHQMLTNGTIRHNVYVAFAVTILSITALFVTADFTNHCFLYNRYLNLLYFAFTIVYGILCIASIHSIPSSSVMISEQSQIAYDCIFIIGTAILSMHTIVAIRENCTLFQRLRHQQRIERKRQRKSAHANAAASSASTATTAAALPEQDEDVTLWSIEIRHIQQHIRAILPGLLLLSMATLLCAVFRDRISTQYCAWIYFGGCLICRGSAVCTRLALVAIAMYACARMEKKYRNVRAAADSRNHFDMVLFFMFSLYLHKCFISPLTPAVPIPAAEAAAARKHKSMYRVYWQCVCSAAIIMANCYTFRWWCTPELVRVIPTSLSWPWFAAVLEPIICFVMVLLQLKEFALTADRASASASCLIPMHMPGSQPKTLSLVMNRTTTCCSSQMTCSIASLNVDEKSSTNLLKSRARSIRASKSSSLYEVLIPIVAPFVVVAALLVNICLTPAMAVLYSLLVYTALLKFALAIKQLLLLVNA